MFRSKKLKAEKQFGVEQAWKIHQAQAEWTGRVDAKASFAFTIESAAIATTVALSDGDRLFSNRSGNFVEVMYWGGLFALLAGAFFAVAVVMPRLRSDVARKAAKNNFIYFGHVRHWDSVELAAALQDSDILAVLTRQIVVMGDIAWKKHRWVQISMVCGAIGGSLIGICGIVLSFVNQ